MKLYLIVVCALSVVATLAWLGYHWLRGLGSAYGNANSATGPGDLTLVFVAVGIVTLGCVAGAFFAPHGIARVLAPAPLAVILLAQIYVGYQQGVRRERHRKAQAVERAAARAKLAAISRDFVRKPGVPDRLGEIRESFLTHDRALGTLVRIDVSHEGYVSAYPVGAIRGDVLETLQQGAEFERWFRAYLDPDGKSLFDRWTVRHRPDQDRKAFGLEKYEIERP